MGRWTAELAPVTGDYQVAVMGRVLSDQTNYQLRELVSATLGNIQLRLVRRTSRTTATIVDSTDTGIPFVAGAWYWLKLRRSGRVRPHYAAHLAGRLPRADHVAHRHDQQYGGQSDFGGRRRLAVRHVGKKYPYWHDLKEAWRRLSGINLERRGVRAVRGRRNWLTQQRGQFRTEAQRARHDTHEFGWPDPALRLTQVSIGSDMATLAEAAASLDVEAYRLSWRREPVPPTRPRMR